MRPIALHFASGLPFFSGAALLAAAAIARLWPAGRTLRRAIRLTAVAATLLAAFSATPLPYWYYGVWTLSIIALMVDPAPPVSAPKARRLGITAWLIVITIAPCLIELLYWRAPIITGRPFHDVVIFADSITAGLGDATTTWPTLLEDEIGTPIADFSRPGETCASALHQVRLARVQDRGDPILVILEIGGNDLLGRAPGHDFEADLDKLLAAVSGPGITVLLMELPLPPLRNSYGLAQRRLARKHGALLLPKRHFARILAARGATVDGLHLSQHGQRLMAGLFAGLLAPAGSPPRPGPPSPH